MVETSDLKMTAVLSAPGELVAVLRQVVDLYNNGHQAPTLQALQSLVVQLQAQVSAEETLLVAANVEEDEESTFLKSWSDILSVEVYVDTEIYASPEAPSLAKAYQEYQKATTDYLQGWQEVAQQLGRGPAITPENMAPRKMQFRPCGAPAPARTG
ncbi:MAG: hypothetical protein HC918_12490, partial [Oscillatoriales cyanobacterium SM2_1_8]|nr:hypothetical protein [Oscillatoriales cyanobacterium SM2_1_8]